MFVEELTLVVDSEARTAAVNMAMDEVLLRSCAEPLLRIYRWARPSVSFGYSGKYAEVERSWRGRDAVRRWTGGGIVPHAEGEDVTYSLAVPASDPLAGMPPLERYRCIHEVVARALRITLPAVQLAAEAHRKISEACFENPVAFDILAEGEKVAGAAQRQTREGLLHQGSIRCTQPAEELADALAVAFGCCRAARDATSAEVRAAEELALTKYGTEAWLRRR